ncbi:MAG TPA: peptidoglycan editing factor PgeF [Phycisphaerae bacterium]|nr:peptidoglycan editing factor PgeF [Phycisphaerae bacterium]
MLKRIQHPNGVVLYQSPLLLDAGVVHGFSTRIGGVSTGPFTSLNLGNPQGQTKDSPENISTNYQRLREALGAADTPFAWVHQVHGNEVAILKSEGESEYAESPAAQIRDRFSGQTYADAIVSDCPGALIAVRIADCVPILLSWRNARLVAVVHAGWRGVVANVIGQTLAAFGELGVNRAEILAAIGPAICLDHFEVGPEVAQEFIAAGLAAAVESKRWPKPHVDLAKAVVLQLQNGKVEKIDAGELCTWKNSTDFFSHRRDNGVTGRMAAVIKAKH